MFTEYTHNISQYFKLQNLAGRTIPGSWSDVPEGPPQSCCRPRGVYVLCDGRRQDARADAPHRSLPAVHQASTHMHMHMHMHMQTV
eukprot:42494-Chlamydomonas_euryale.AAC.4